MARRMLIDASHPEETRVVVVDGTRLEEFDFETASRKPLKGNIYLAKVIRIEPSLQAAFVEYGGNRHGFLAFSEIHADYYQIPVADRERLIAEQQRLHAEADDEPEPRHTRVDRTDIEEARAEREQAIAGSEDESSPAAMSGEAEALVGGESGAEVPVLETTGLETTAIEMAAPGTTVGTTAGETAAGESDAAAGPGGGARAAAMAADKLAGPAEISATEPRDTETGLAETAETAPVDATGRAAGDATSGVTRGAAGEATRDATGDVTGDAALDTSSDTSGETTGDATGDGASSVPSDPAEAPQPDVAVEVLGGDDAGEERETRERRRRHPVRHYKIQEVIKRRQILLVQVVKEERGNKGAALTTYLSLAGRYCVLMPNAGRGGGISRKISNPADRKRMKEMLSQLDVPQGMGVILRTAGLERSNIDIKRDYEYLSRLWDSIREITMRSTAPALIYEEGDLIKRSLRDIYDTDIAQVLVEGEAGFEAASGFMRQLVPHQASKVELYNEPIPLFHRYQVEAQFDAMHSPVVQLRSGGYIVINPTEALVAIDVNSGRSTKERNIEETAVRTNLEAAEEVARQVRLRDLAGLIVIDFIDMEENRHQRQVEHKVKESMRTDRARIQIGRISAFGLLEMSRQRLRPSLLEHSTEICPHCAGTGRVRSIESAALHALRAVEEEGVRRRASEIAVTLPPNVALYLLNHKRHTLTDIEKRYGFSVTIEADEELHAADCEIERIRSRRGGGEDHRPLPELARASYDAPEGAAPLHDDDDIAEGVDAGPERERLGESRGEGRADGEGDVDSQGRRRRRRRRRGGRRDGDDRPPRDSERGDGHRESSYARENGAHENDAHTNGAAGNGIDHPAGGDAGPSDEHAPGEHDINGAAASDDRPGDDREPGERAEGDRLDGDRRRRRGRRGGRRRRRENGEGEAGDRAPREQAGSWDQAPEHGSDHSSDIGGDDQPASPPVPMNGNAMDHGDDGHMPPVERQPYVPPPIAAVAAPVTAPVIAPVMAPPPQPIHASAPQPAPVAAEPPPPPVVPTISADTPPEKPKRGWWRR